MKVASSLTIQKMQAGWIGRIIGVYLSEYCRNRREMRFRKGCIKMAVRKSVPDSLYYAEEIYRWVKAIPDKKS